MSRRRVLLGWEIGESRGHVLRLRDIAVRLRQVGVTVIWAVTRLDQLDGIALPGEPVFQSPLWPGAHAEFAAGKRRRPHLSHADILADLGLAVPGAFGQLLVAWDTILRVVKPDAVFADYAPALMAASRHRVPVVAAGIGFVLPPAHLPRFPRYQVPALDAIEQTDCEPALLDEVNAGLKRLRRPALTSLPALYGADVTYVSAFRALDPYAAHRRERPVPPSLMNWSSPSHEQGDGIVVYWSERLLGRDDVLTALAGLGVPVRVVAPGVRPEHVASHAGLGNLIFLNQPLPFADIAKARLVVSNGSTGFVSAAMLAGLPQAILAHDLQKELVGLAVAELGVGFAGLLQGFDATGFQERLRALYDAGAVRTQALVMARRLIPLMHEEPAALCSQALQQLCSGADPAGFARPVRTPASPSPIPLLSA